MMPSATLLPGLRLGRLGRQTCTLAGLLRNFARRWDSLFMTTASALVMSPHSVAFDARRRLSFVSGRGRCGRGLLTCAAFTSSASFRWRRLLLFARN